MFAGGNSARGFYSLFDQMFSSRIEQVFLLKGGPGTGKSTLMQNLAQYAVEHNQPVELFYCSSDPNSLDGIVLPLQQTGMVDATAPHVQDPTFPGCREEIINLGDNWNRTDLLAAKGEIITLTKANKAAYAKAYRYLRAAEEMEELWAEINQAHLQAEGVRAVVRMLFEALQLTESRGELGGGLERHLFASAITPDGLISHIGELVQDYPRRWVLRCAPGTGVQAVFTALVSAARLAGVYAEVFHRPLIPTQIEHMLFPELGNAVLSHDELSPWDAAGEVIDLRGNVDQDEVPQRVKDLYRELLESGIEQLAQAKSIHDELERFYIDAVDFARLEKVRAQLHARIFAG